MVSSTTGKIRSFPSELALELLRICDEYDVSPHLSEGLEKLIVKYLMTRDNVIVLYHYALLNNAKQLEEAAILLIKTVCVGDSGWMKTHHSALSTVDLLKPL